MDIIDDDDDWIDIQRSSGSSVVLLAAAVGLTKGKNPKNPKVISKARGRILLRGEYAKWAEDNGPRFRLQIGGSSANRIRLIPDAAAGAFEAHSLKGTIKISLGVVNLWPDEDRAPVAAQVSVTPAGLVLTVPESFTQATRAQPAPAVQPRAPALMPSVISAPATTRAAQAQSFGAFRRTVALGEPSPGRSALDQRKAEGRE
jgi:hypothetical protein